MLDSTHLPHSIPQAFLWLLRIRCSEGLLQVRDDWRIPARRPHRSRSSVLIHSSQTGSSICFGTTDISANWSALDNCLLSRNWQMALLSTRLLLWCCWARIVVHARRILREPITRSNIRRAGRRYLDVIIVVGIDLVLEARAGLRISGMSG